MIHTKLDHEIMFLQKLRLLWSAKSLDKPFGKFKEVFNDSRILMIYIWKQKDIQNINVICA